MDDPLAALDAHVKKKIFEEVFLNLMSEKTRILVTHSLDCLPNVDRIILMHGGQIIFDGNFDEFQ